MRGMKITPIGELTVELHPVPGAGSLGGAGGASGTGEIVRVIGYQVGVDAKGQPVLYRLESFNLGSRGGTRAVEVPGGIEQFGMPSFGSPAAQNPPSDPNDTRKPAPPLG